MYTYICIYIYIYIYTYIYIYVYVHVCIYNVCRDRYVQGYKFTYTLLYTCTCTYLEFTGVERFSVVNIKIIEEKISLFLRLIQPHKLRANFIQSWHVRERHGGRKGEGER